MGKFVGWHCDKCGEGESFSFGGGMLGLNDPEVVKRSKCGEYGFAMKALFGDGIPDGWVLSNENAFYECPSCGGVVDGGAVLIDERSGCLLSLYVPPEKCPSCGNEFSCMEDKVPMSFNELFNRCTKISEGACPKCGADAVEIDFGYWD